MTIEMFDDHELRRPEPAVHPDFMAWYAHYPRKVARKAAEKAWNKCSLHEKRRAIRDTRDKQRGARDPDWTRDGGKFIPHPATYLNQGRYDDEWVAEDPARVEGEI